MLNERVWFASMLLAALLLLMAGVAAASDYTGATPTGATPPPVSQPLTREGDLAVKLVQAFSLGTSHDEVEAEDQLSKVGITPKNGWVADYPVTPDIAEEIRQTVRDAASSGKIEVAADTAVASLDDLLARAGLPVVGQTEGSPDAEPVYTDGGSAVPPDYQSPTTINNYYVSEGPPAVTYYAPPPDYAYLYGWVPYPFWCAGFYFPGFFVLHDFHRSVFFDNRRVFVSNHFRDFRSHRFLRVDPVARLRGSNVAGTGVIGTGSGSRGSFTRGSFVGSPRRDRSFSFGSPAQAPARSAAPTAPTTATRTLTNATPTNVTPRVSGVPAPRARETGVAAFSPGVNRGFGVQSRSPRFFSTGGGGSAGARTFTPGASIGRGTTGSFRSGGSSFHSGGSMSSRGFGSSGRGFASPGGGGRGRR